MLQRRLVRHLLEQNVLVAPEADHLVARRGRHVPDELLQVVLGDPVRVRNVELGGFGLEFRKCHGGKSFWDLGLPALLAVFLDDGSDLFSGPVYIRTPKPKSLIVGAW